MLLLRNALLAGSQFCIRVNRPASMTSWPTSKQPVTYEVVDLLDIEVPPLPPPVQNVDGSGARLMIDRIEVENFKSYYGKHTIGPFHKNFSSIVGPNGSGKSNVIDSLLFVFGYKASRTRGKKATDMLHKSANHKELAHCSVEVHFHKVVDKGTDECEIVPHSQFSVKRLLTRDNKSTYYWSKKMEKTNVVTDKLRKLGIDLDHNRFLILQGEVEKIALMKPRGEPGKPDDEGMLEYLEDIIGSSRLKAPIEKLTEKVDELQQLRTDRLNRMKTAEKAKAEWEGPKDALVDFLVKSNEVVWNKNKLYHIEKFSARGNLNEAMTQKASKVEEQEQTEAAIACIEADLKRRQDQIKKTKKELESIEKKYAAVQERKKELDDAGDANKQSRSERILQKQELRKEKDKCEKELDTARKSGDTLPAKIEQLRKEVEECEDREKNVEASVAAGRHKVDSETKPIQEKLVDLEKQLAERAQVEDKCKASRDEAQNELDRLKLDENREQKKLREVGLKIEEAEQKLQKHETDRENARTYLERLKSEQETAQEELKTLEAQEPQLAKTYSNRLQNKTDCEERLQQQKAAKGGKGALNTLLRAQKDGKIKGIIGRLGDLGSIDEKVDGQVVDPSGTMTGGGNSEQRGRITINDSRGGAAAAQRRRSDQIATEENLQILNAAVEQSKAQLNELRQKIGSLREKMTKNESAIRQLHNNLSASEKGAKMAAEMIETHKKSLGAQEKRAADAKADPERVQQIEETIKEREKEMLAARERAEKIGKTVDLEKAKIDEITHRLLGKEMDKLKAIQTEKKDANDRIVKSNATLDRFKRKESSSSKRIEEINAELEENQREIEKLKEAYEELKVQVSAVFKEEIERNDEILQKRNELEQLTNQSDGDLGSELVEKKKQLNVIKQKVQSLVELVHDAKRKFDEKKASLSHLKLEDLNKLLDGIGGLAFRGGAKQKQAQRPTTSGTDPDASTEEDEENEGGAENNEQGPVKNEPTVPTGNLELDPEFEFDPTAAKLPKYDDRVIERWIGRGTLEDAISCVATMLHALETQVKSAKVDKRAIEEFKKREQKYLECYELLEEATKRREDHRRKLDELRKRRLSEFFAGFEAISLKLKEMYQTITIGGDAELVLKDKCDPFSEGVEFGVRPPKKSWKEIANLSGGEKTLASLALVFALHHYKPTPLYVMDEIDAALDFKNVSIIAHYVKERTKNAQFIIISLRNHMFELADRLVGIYKTHDCTKHVVIDPKRIALGTPAAQMSETSVRPLAQRNVSDTSNDAVVPTQ